MTTKPKAKKFRIRRAAPVAGSHGGASDSAALPDSRITGLSDAPVSQRDTLSLLVQDKPWELASLAFLFGFTYRDDPALRQWLLREAMQTLANDTGHEDNNAPDNH